MLLGGQLQCRDDFPFNQTENDEGTGFGGPFDQGPGIRRQPDFTEDLEAPGTLELKHRRPNGSRSRLAGPVRDHEDLHHGFLGLSHPASLPETRSGFIR